MKKILILIAAIAVLFGAFYINSKKAADETPLVVTEDEKTVVEKYVRDNIATIATDKAVLGGTWYVTAVSVDPVANTGTVSYEDGHIASSATFAYTITDGKVTVSNWKKIK